MCVHACVGGGGGRFVYVYFSIYVCVRVGNYVCVCWSMGRSVGGWVSVPVSVPASVFFEVGYLWVMCLRVAVCCSVLQCVAVCCSVLQRVAVCLRMCLCFFTWCLCGLFVCVLQCVAVCCSVLHCVCACVYVF